MTEPIEVAVAIILREDGRVLLAQRPDGKSWAGWWEFPGGKIEYGESPDEALQREIHEELDIRVSVYNPWISREFEYPQHKVKLHFFIVRAWCGEPQSKEKQRLSWEKPNALKVGPLLPANTRILEALCLPSIYAISHLAEMGATRFFEALERALESGLRLIQVREKQLNADRLIIFSRQVIDKARSYGARVVINADPVLALSCDADGVHLSAKSLMKLSKKPEGLLCGASCHNLRELTQAVHLDLDYVLLAPVQSTLTHPGMMPIGWENFAVMASKQPVPIYALGGLNLTDLATAWQYGAHGIAMLRGAWQ